MNRIYVASSWRNPHQPKVVQRLREAEYLVYDFRNPPYSSGFSWSAIDPNWENWTPEVFRRSLTHPIAINGCQSDMAALQAADIVVLVLPCGRSAHLELGYAVGAGKPTFILMLEPNEPALMYNLCTGICLDVDELIQQLDLHQELPIEYFVESVQFLPESAYIETGIVADPDAAYREACGRG